MKSSASLFLNKFLIKLKLETVLSSSVFDIGKIFINLYNLKQFGNIYSY